MADAPRGIDRRSLLIGGAAGAVGASAVAAGGIYVKGQLTPFIAQVPVADGAPPQIAESYAASRPTGDRPAQAPAGAPNIVAIILDDVGFADLGCYGSEIPTPAIDALAGRGLRYANFRTTAMCSPTRASF
ncbi:MAG: sulfatase-like hydrolase/transferase, partial [Sphingomonas sp.]|nr:sulfatase-like hydrolase/transferase [Sphingomonas sp.]